MTWSKKEAFWCIFANIFIAGILLTGAVVDLLNGFNLWISVVAVFMSGVCLSVAHMVFDTYTENI
jgi:ABC-type uncharacterized transport system permease subunit